LQDAAIKWLVADYSVVSILFWRALVVVLACLLVGRLRLVQRAWHSPSRRLLVVRGLLSIVAWVLYYTAARDLTLAEMTTLYFSAPIMVTVLAAVILKERASAWQWFSLIIGFVGVIIACRPDNLADPVPVILTLLAAMCWAFTYIQLRQVDEQTSVLEQMLITNVVFVICMTVALPWNYTPAPTPAWLGMLGAGLVGGIPVSSSGSRTAIGDAVGQRTQLGGLVTDDRDPGRLEASPRQLLRQEGAVRVAAPASHELAAGDDDRSAGSQPGCASETRFGVTSSHRRAPVPAPGTARAFPFRCRRRLAGAKT